MNQLLIIEDDQSLRESITEIFSENGFKVSAAADGLSGIKLANLIQPDLIICDLKMPGLDGFEVKKNLSDNLRTSSIPFIFLTAHKDIQSMQKGMELGADDYITKPVKMKILLNLVLKRLERIKSIKSGDNNKSALNKMTVSEQGKYLIKTRSEHFLITWDDLILISADGYYSILHLKNGKKVRLKRTLKNWLSILPVGKFLQIHRNMVINTESIEKIEPWAKGTYIARLKFYPDPVYFSQRCSRKIRKELSLKSFLVK